MASLSISVPPALRDWVAARVAEGSYADVDDYFRDLIRRDQQQTDEDARLLRAMVDEGLASGIIEEEPEAVIDAIIAGDHRADA